MKHSPADLPAASPAAAALGGDPREVLKTGTDFHILASALAGRRITRALVSSEGFAVLDAGGDVAGTPAEPMGYFHTDMRYLSRLELRIAGTIPLLLSSYLSDDCAELRVNLTNPDLTDGAETIVLPRDSLQIERSCVLAGEEFFQRILFRNFSHDPLELSVEFLFDADFADLFEVRGVKRKRHGQRLPPRLSGRQVEFYYDGLDGVERSAVIAFEPVPRQFAANCASYHLALASNEASVITLRIAAKAGNIQNVNQSAKLASFAEALTSRRAQLTELRGAWAIVTASNESFDLLLNRSAAALNSLISERADGTFIMAGIPWYATLFGRDSIITALAMLPYYPAIASRTLRTLAHFQGSRIDSSRDEQPGKIVHEMRVGEMAATGEVPFGRYYGSADATPLFLWLLGEYVAATGDLALARDLWPSVERALEWIDRFGDQDGDGYVEYSRETPRGLANQGWKDSFDSISHSDGSLAQAPIALAEVQGYVFAAYSALAKVSNQLGADTTADLLEAKAATLKRSFLRDFWNCEAGLIALALDRDKKPCQVMSSNGAHCLATGLFDDVPAASLGKRLMADDMFCGWGIRTLSSAERRYNPMSYHNGSVWPHDNAIAAMGLARIGDHAAVSSLVTALAQAAEKLDTGSLPELFCGFARETHVGPVPYPVACHPQAWSASSVFMLVTAMLGMRIDGFDQHLRFTSPTLPQWLDSLRIEKLHVGAGSASLLFTRTPSRATVEILDKTNGVTVEILD